MHIWVMQMPPEAGDGTYSHGAAYGSSAGQLKLASRQNNNLLQQEKRLFFPLVFLPHCLLRDVSKSIAFHQQNYTDWGCGCILHFILIFFSSVYQLLAWFRCGWSQGKCDMFWFLVCGRELICLWVQGWGICKSLDCFFCSVVCMWFEEERESLDSKVKFVFFKQQSICLYAEYSLLDIWFFFFSHIASSDAGVGSKCSYSALPTFSQSDPVP